MSKPSLGKAAKRIRESVGLSQRDAAKELGISDVYLCNIERDKKTPSLDLMNRFHDAWGIDLYMLACCLHGVDEKLSPEMRRATEAMLDVWREELGRIATP